MLPTKELTLVADRPTAVVSVMASPVPGPPLSDSQVPPVVPPGVLKVYRKAPPSVAASSRPAESNRRLRMVCCGPSPPAPTEMRSQVTPPLTEMNTLFGLATVPRPPTTTRRGLVGSITRAWLYPPKVVMYAGRSNRKKVMPESVERNRANWSAPAGALTLATVAYTKFGWLGATSTRMAPRAAPGTTVAPWPPNATV